MKELAKALEKQRLLSPTKPGLEDEEVQKLCLQAEGLMELSAKLEADRDHHTALAKCTQAIGEH